MTTFGRKERRRLQRVMVAANATVHCLDGGPGIAGVSSNVSAEGIFLWSDVNLAPGRTVELVLHLPSHASAATKLMLWCLGKVVRSVHSDGRFGLAIAFDEVEITQNPASRLAQ